VASDEPLPKDFPATLMALDLNDTAAIVDIFVTLNLSLTRLTNLPSPLAGEGLGKRGMVMSLQLNSVPPRETRDADL
jgi:hypothetical protein